MEYAKSIISNEENMNSPKTAFMSVTLLLGAVMLGGPPPTCPPIVPDCPLGFFGPYGGWIHVCCQNVPDESCINWKKRKMVCNYANGEDPVTYGYELQHDNPAAGSTCDLVSTWCQ